MEPAAGRVVDLFRDRRGEGDDIMVESFFQFLLAFDEFGGMSGEIFRTRFDSVEVGPRNDAFCDQRCAGEEFDLEPDLELVFVRPDGAHFGARVAADHDRGL